MIFFFQAEDGIRDGHVTGVQTCALPIFIIDIGLRGFLPASLVEMRRVRDLEPYIGQELEAKIIELDKQRNNVVLSRREIGRASCRERVWLRVGEVYGQRTRVRI